MKLRRKFVAYALLAYFVASTTQLLRASVNDDGGTGHTTTAHTNRRPVLDLRQYRRNITTDCRDLTGISSFRDPTMQLLPCVNRPWLQPESHKPPVKLVLTNFGWNSQESLNFTRSTRSRELLQAVVDHPLFDALSEWDKVPTKADAAVRHYVFLDVETCFETNYPTFGLEDYQNNYDTQGGRVFQEKQMGVCYDIEQCIYISKVLNSPLFRHNDATLVYFDCRGNGVPVDFRRRSQPSTQLALVSLSSSSAQLQPSIDQGLPPPFSSKHENYHALSAPHVTRISRCQGDRPYLLTFVGDIRDERRAADIFRLHNPSGAVQILAPQQLRRKFQLDVTKFRALSRFVVVPREDTHFSYQFVHVLAAGSIPVVYSDHWVWPFRPELVNWSKCAIVVMENRISETLQVLKRISPNEECERRKYCYEIYRRYLATPDGVIDGIIEGLELAKGK